METNSNQLLLADSNHLVGDIDLQKLSPKAFWFLNPEAVQEQRKVVEEHMSHTLVARTHPYLMAQLASVEHLSNLGVSCCGKGLGDDLSM